MAALRAGGAAEGPVSEPSPEGGPGCCVPGPVPGVSKAHVSGFYDSGASVKPKDR